MEVNASMILLIFHLQNQHHIDRKVCHQLEQELILLGPPQKSLSASTDEQRKISPREIIS
jgi:hypothetical protein